MTLIDKIDKNTPAASTWITTGAAIAAIADALTNVGNPQLAVVGLIVASIFKLAEALSNAWVQGKKLETEKQFITTTGAPSPSVLASAKEAGLPVKLEMSAPKMDAPAPVIQP